MREATAVILTMTAGAAGGLTLAAFGVPAGALIGSSLAIAALGAFAGIGRVPDGLRDIGFVLIGVSLGSGVDAELGAHLIDWALSLGMLAASLVVTLFVGSWVMRRYFGLDAETAVLATSPGTMSNAIALAVEGKGDVSTIMALQVMRLVVLAILIPPLAAILNADAHAAPAREFMSPWVLAALFAVSYLASHLLKRFDIPAAGLLAGLIISGTAHASDLAHGAAPVWANFAGFVIVGATLGTRITKVGVGALLQFIRAGSVLLLVMLLVALIFAGLTSVMSGLPLPQILIAFAPGGVEAMAAIGLSLGFDPAFIALHHFLRIVILIVLVPVFLKWFTGKNRG